jgi:hypothetical protein
MFTTQQNMALARPGVLSGNIMAFDEFENLKEKLIPPRLDAGTLL